MGDKTHSRGKALTRFRRTEEMTHTKLAGIFGLTRSSVLYKFEKGQRDLTLQLAAAVSLRCGISYTSLLTRSQAVEARKIQAALNQGE